MARPRNPKRDEAYQIWLKSEGNKQLKDIAAELDVSPSQIRNWKKQDNWEGDSIVAQRNSQSLRNETKKDETPKELVIESEDLTEKQQLFCLYYIKCFNATKAYQKAYGCSYRTAGQNGYALLKNTEIKNEITRLKAEQQQELYLEDKDVLQKYIDIAFADITDFVDFGKAERAELDDEGKPIFDEKGAPVKFTYSFVDLKDSEEVDGTIITEVKKGKDGVSVKLADKMRALDFLAKYVDLLSENDKKKLQEEKLKAEIEAAKGPKEGQNTKDWKQAVIEAANKRAVKDNEQ